MYVTVKDIKMKFEILKQDFKSYLDEQSKITKDTGDDEETVHTEEVEAEDTNGDLSLFNHADDFKTYLEEKIPEKDIELQAKDVDDVLKMKVSSEGKLVKENETEKTPKTNDVSVFESNKTSKEPDNSKPQTVTNTEKNSNSKDTSEDKKAPDDDIFTGVFNELMKEDKFKEAIDSDGSGEINDEELKDFVDKIKGLDDNDKNVSVNDLLTAAEQIKNDVFNVPESEDKFTEKEVDDIKQDMTDSAPSSAENIPARSNVGGVSSVPIASGSQTAGGSIPNAYDSSISAKTTENMSEADLERELEKAKNDLSEKQTNLNAIIDESDASIKALKDNVDKTYQSYQEKVKAVDVEMAKQVDELNQKINAKQTEINNKDKAISDKESAVSGAEASYNSAKSNRENLEGILKELKSSNTKDNNLNSQISAVNSQLSAAKKAEESAKKALETAKKELEKLKKERKELEEGNGGLNSLKEQMTKLEAEIAAKYPEVKQAQEDWDKAKETLTTEKSSASEKAQGDVKNAQKHVNEVEKALTDYKNNEAQSKYNNKYSETAGKKLASAAHNVRGTVGYCLGGVADSLEAVYGAGCIPNINSAYQAADILASNKGIGAHFTEVQVKREDLPKLPAGAIVVWNNNANGGGSNVSAAGKVHGHISIALGNGQESSDHIANQIVNRDATFRVFYPKS